MNLKHWTGLFCSALALITTGCSEDKYSPATDTGTIVLSLDVDREVLTANPARSSLSQICDGLTAADFTIRLTDAKGESQEWPYSSFTGQNIKIGTYTIEAYSGREGEEGFDKAYFRGAAQVAVTTDNTSSVSVTAALANSAVKVVYTDAFKKYMTNYSASVRTAGATDGIAYGPDATDELFVNPGETSLYVTFTTPQNKTATLKAAQFTTVARHSYTVTIDVNSGNVGDAVLTVTFDDTTVAENVEITLSDELLNMPAPTVTATPAAVDIIEGHDAEARFDVIALGSIDDLVLTTASDWLTAQGWPAEINLAKATAEQLDELTRKGLKLRVAKDMAVVDLSGVLPTIRVDGGAAATATFRLEATDTYGKVSDPAAEISVTVSPLHLEITGNGVFMVNDTEVALQVTYNGADLANDVEFEAYYADRAVWEPAPVVNIVNKAPSRTDAAYEVTVKVPGGSSNVKVRASVPGVVSVEHELVRGIPDFTLSNLDIDNFATHATVTMESDDVAPASIAPAATYTVHRADGQAVSGVKATISGNKVMLTGLPAGEQLTVTAELAGKTASTPLTTEAAAQIPNGNLDADVTIAASGAAWQNVVFQTWGTNNALTTSEPVGGWSHNPVGDNRPYKAISGTILTTDSHSGNAALIRSVGWGLNNSATGSSGTDGTCKYRDAGLLHLGATRAVRPAGYSENDYNGCGPVTVDDLDCGMAFTSRPKSMTFWYKYSPYNQEDRALAEIVVTDASGSAIASETVNLAAASSYQEHTVALTYPAAAAKASKIYVRFQSTGDMKFLERANFSGPGFANRDGSFMGSQLYIDDVTLNY